MLVVLMVMMDVEVMLGVVMTVVMSVDRVFMDSCGRPGKCSLFLGS